jgi:FlaG/FlaF family flagellin (archaellin)
MMRAIIPVLSGVATLMLLGACNNAKSPETASKDIAQANRSASEEVAKARNEEQKDANADNYNVAVAQADGDHKIAVQKCETLEGKDQQACKDKADADYEAAKANAKATKVSQQP